MSFQQEQNPDVNTFNIDSDDPGEGVGSGESNEPGENSPVPPDTAPSHPVEEPPETEKPPVGDVDDSPKQIV